MVWGNFILFSRGVFPFSYQPSYFKVPLACAINSVMISSSTDLVKFCCIVFCIVFLGTNLWARELEIYLGPAAIAARKAISIPSYPATTFDASQASKMSQHLNDLEKKFSKAGGLDLIGKASFVRWAWLSSDLKSWIMQIPISFEDSKKIEQSLLRTNWKKDADRVYRRENLIITTQSEKVFVGHNISIKDLRKESGYWSIPSCEWFQVKAFKPLFDELAQRQPRLDALLSYLIEINWSWSSGDLVMDLQLTSSEKATSLLVSANAAVQLIKNLIINQGPYSLENWHLLDFISYSQASINSKSVELIFERLRFQSFGKVFQVKYLGVGDFGVFLTDALPKMIVSVVMAILPQYSKHRDRLGSLIASGVKGANSDVTVTMSKDSCDAEIKMIRQAVEFYNLDHLKKGKYDQIKSKLFEEGYLPEDLSCDGKLIKNHKFFYTDSDGDLIRNRASQ
tara:strand:+ start:3070 stop:4428 length:1359 start_codon:yes stop_codon:yes gene_type:complete